MGLKEDAAEMQFMVSQRGWQILEQKIEKEFEDEYKKLRKSKRDSAFYKTQGKLDGLEFVKNLPKTLIDRGELF